MRIEEQDTDGNCLFRSVAYQVYGEENMYHFMRQKCMDYIIVCRDYFKDFIDRDIDGNIEEYCLRKRADKVWGDDIEIEALSEIYGRPIEIYAYSSQPMRTFHEQPEEGEEQLTPIRVSYHGRNHYNAVVPQDWAPLEHKLVKEEAGTIED